jgi:PAS domain S-box-containing protein
VPVQVIEERAADELARVSQQQDLILNAVGEGIYGLDRAGRCTFVNPAAARMLGYADDELIDRPMHDVVHRAKEDGSAYPAEECPVLATLRDGAVHRVAGEVLWRKDGTLFPVEYVSAPLRTGSQTAGAVVAFRDVTERQRVERALRENHAILRAVIDGTTDAIFVKDRAGRYRMINVAGARFLGKSADEIVGRDDSTLFTDGTGEEIMARDRAVMARGETLTYEEVGTAAGVTRTYLATKGVYRDEQGKVAGLIGISRDISERKRVEEERIQLLQREQLAHAAAEEALRRERVARAEAERLAAERAAILGKVADGVIIADPSGRIAFVNDAACHLFDLANLAVPSHAAPDDGHDGLTVLYPLQRAALHGETVVGTDLVLHRPSGKEIALEASATPVRSDDGTNLGAVLTLRDVTAPRELERQKDEFLANVSHDLRTPLTGIKASIGVVLANEPPNLPAPLHRLLVNIDLAADRMTALVADLLELTRLRAGRVLFRPEVRDLREVAREAAQTIEPLAQERAQCLELDLPTEPLQAPVDADRLERALLNVLGNAQKYGPAGGTIRLRLEQRSGEAIFAVADDGPGIAEADQEHLFERFFRADSEATRHNQGSGLGLPIARAMVELHGGRIWLESTVGVGTTFWIAVPLPAR